MAMGTIVQLGWGWGDECHLRASVGFLTRGAIRITRCQLLGQMGPPDHSGYVPGSCTVNAIACARKWSFGCSLLSPTGSSQ